MKKLTSCVLLFFCALVVELGLAVIGTIVANRTDAVGLGWAVFASWLVTVTVFGYLNRKGLCLIMRAIVLFLSLGTELIVFDLVCLPLLRDSPILK